jgi:glycerol-3-phosphate acyltransferase PlsY
VTFLLGTALVLVLAYLVGAVPIGLLVGRLTRGIDIRRYGSRRTGATNALRILGRRAAVTVFVLDVGKGVAAVLLARALVEPGPDGAGEWVAAAAGVVAIVGHNWSIFIGFSGGRGVATSAGALLALLPAVLLVVGPLVAIVTWRWRYVSLGSIVGAVLVPVVAAASLALGIAGAHPAHLGYGLAAGLLVIAAHADNIARLRTGSERKIGQAERLDG